MATLTVVESNDGAGIDTDAAALDTLSTADQFPNDGRTVIIIDNASGGPLTPVFVVQKPSVDVPGLGTLTKANGGGAVAAAERRLFGPFPTALYNDGNGMLQMTIAGAASIKGKAIRIVTK